MGKGCEVKIWNQVVILEWLFTLYYYALLLGLVNLGSALSPLEHGIHRLLGGVGVDLNKKRVR